MSQPGRLRVYMEALFAVVVWGGTFIATKIALRDISPATLVWLRFGIGVLVLGSAVALRNQFALPARRDLAYFTLLGFLGVTLHQWLQATGLLTAQATTSAWIVSTIPIFTALLGWFILKERLGWLRLAGILVAFTGVLLVVSGGNLRSVGTVGAATIGDLLILLSAVNWAIFSVLSRRGLQHHPAARMMFYVMLMGWLLSNVWLFGPGPGLGEVPALTRVGWTSVLLLGVFGSGLAYIAWYDALRELPASQLSVFIYIEPLVTLVLAASILGETITLASVVGGAMIIGGVYAVNSVRDPEQTYAE
jgi:drug/metabolite transporter (DMT)-like permease